LTGKERDRLMPVDQLRIAMLSAHSCPVGKLGTKDTGGMSVYIRELACELGKLGHSVDIYTRGHDPNDREMYELSPNARLIHLRAGEDEEIGKLAVYSHLPDFVDNLETFRIANSLRYDLIFSHYWLSGLAGTRLQRSWHVPHITMFHTLGAVKNAVREEACAAPGEDEPALRVEAERDLVQNCDRIIASTERGRQELVRYYDAPPDKISVVPCGVNLEQFRPLDRAQARLRLAQAYPGACRIDGEKLALFVGRLDPLKGLDRLIEALPYLGDIVGLRLVVVGGDEHNGHEIEQLRQLACDLNVQDAVGFWGLVKHEQLPYYYSAADVCVVPSYYESFGLVALESLACGTPVLATDVGNHRQVIREGQTGYVIADNAPHRIADRMALLLSQPRADDDMTQAIRATVAEYGWPSIAEAISNDCQLAVAHYRHH
jgi:D-inositol-3-phosphate glycosyltransferase